MKSIFSERMGYKKPRTVIQSESMDDSLRTALWNAIYKLYFIGFLEQQWFRLEFTEQNCMFIKLWTEFFNQKIDEIPSKTKQGVDYIKERFLKFEWFEVYDIVEFIIELTDEKLFVYAINSILEENLSGYRVISKEIVPIISEQEIESIESALQIHNIVSSHLEASLKLLSDKTNPNYRNSIKESISAVEAIAKLIVGKPKATLGTAIKEIENAGKIQIHKALRDGFMKLYGWTSDDEGIRHSLMDEPTLSQEDAVYMLVTCSAFINYLNEKYRKFDLNLSGK